MVSNNSSGNKRVRRSKSSASVQNRRPAMSEAFDSELAQLQALAAASLAMRRHDNRPSSSLSSSKKWYDHSSSTDGSYHQQPLSQPGDIKDESESYCRTSATESTILPRMSESSGVMEQNRPNICPASPRPSSYRRLRKSKSMFTTSHESERLCHGSGNNQRTSSGTSRLSRRTLRRSLSFFRGSSISKADKENHATVSTLPIELAREQFQRSMEEKRVANGSESIVTRSSRQVPKPFKKSMRSNGTNAGSTTPSRYASTGTHCGPKGRLFSFSIKNSIRRIFGRRPSSSREELPKQHGAHHDFGSFDVGSSEGSYFDESSDYAKYQEQLLSQNVANTAPSVRSMKSCSSMATSNSRVTSWTDSTAGNTLTMKQFPPLTRQGLDIIREDSDVYTPTPSPGRHRHDGYSIFRQPLDNTVDIDSQRMFSALMRNIDETKNRRKTNQAPLTKSKAKSSHDSSTNGSPLTIRAVKQSPNTPSARQSMSGSRASPSSRSLFSVRSSRTVKLTPQEIARKNEMVSRKRSDQTIRGLGRLDLSGTSIYENKPTREWQNEQLEMRDDTGSVIINISQEDGDIPPSPSVYSRTTEARSPYRLNVDSSDSDEEEPGTVTILDSQRLPYPPRRSSQAARGISSDWKTWMNSQMDLIDAAARSASLANPTYALPGHYREDTQINGPSPEELKRVVLARRKQSSRGVPSPSSTAGGRSTNGEPRVNITEALSIPNNNFSRPLRSSPNGNLSTCSTVVRKPSITTSAIRHPCTPLICDSEMTPSPLSVRARSMSRTPTTATVPPLQYNKTRPTEDGAILEDSSLINSGQSSEGQSGPSVSPICLNDGKRLLQEIQFNSVRPRREQTNGTKENKWASASYRQNGRPNYASKLNGLHSTISTKRMVDIFLSERSQPPRGSADDSAPEPAFL
ncbi:conserved hypothetical protein [Trichophyton verrucosum HKI 0517]|uniref:Uncharacterized protein n=1 Tax=Trichophyton verrucosum (strain HKI 0517) TaxID=663202 RepID=D4D402_TRIVH|nr:uncharacterized protein TRV_01815 [Trichophyton verrucosum HKI 0517]EFE43430.1 conserved hypothetical protein [Trichophyton verrucosum HKI 0517]